MSGQPPTPDIPAELMAALDALFESDERWRHTAGPGGSGPALIQRAWPDGTVDTIMLLSPVTAWAVRETSDGRRPWSEPGDAVDVIDAARQMAAPDAPDAPDAPNDADSGPPRGELR